MAFYDDRGTMRDLNTMSDAPAQGVTLTDAWKVVANDNILCQGTTNGKTRTYILQKQ